MRFLGVHCKTYNPYKKAVQIHKSENGNLTLSKIAKG